jgi:hypothetical protein
MVPGFSCPLMSMGFGVFLEVFRAQELGSLIACRTRRVIKLTDSA